MTQVQHVGPAMINDGLWQKRNYFNKERIQMEQSVMVLINLNTQMTFECIYSIFLDNTQNL